MLDVDAGVGTEAPVDCNLDFLGILKLSAFLIFLGNCSLTIITYIYFFLGLSDPQSGNQQSNIQQIDNKESDNRHSKNQHSGNQQSDNEESDGVVMAVGGMAVVFFGFCCLGIGVRDLTRD